MKELELVRVIILAEGEYYLVDEELILTDHQEATEYAKRGARVEVGNQISGDIQEFENFYYYNEELWSKDDYILSHDNDIVERA